jgi:hypothetical protein
MRWYVKEWTHAERYCWHFPTLAKAHEFIDDETTDEDVAWEAECLEENGYTMTGR